MAFGIYVHIPYCLQKCHYCDFVTLPATHQLRPQVYTGILVEEIRSRADAIDKAPLTSIYFGGGTPSLLPPEEIGRVIEAIRESGFTFASDIEISLEINPGTMNDEVLKRYESLGINRYSVGVQSFEDTQLKKCGREHSSRDTMETLTLLRESGVNYTTDILFGLPGQKIEDLETDIGKLLEFQPKHVSAYNLTIPTKHFMNEGRATDDEQAKMFSAMSLWLSAHGLKRYEISNFAVPGFESRHNTLYWSDQPYWGVGISSHSYLPRHGPWGTRFWNPKTVDSYLKQVKELASSGNSKPFYERLPEHQIESLAKHESLTDFCHTHLRRTAGLAIKKLAEKYGENSALETISRLRRLAHSGLIEEPTDNIFRLTENGVAMANQAFLELTFLSK